MAVSLIPETDVLQITSFDQLRKVIETMRPVDGVFTDGATIRVVDGRLTIGEIGLSQIPEISDLEIDWENITGKPTTLDGFGIEGTFLPFTASLYNLSQLDSTGSGILVRTSSVSWAMRALQPDAGAILSWTNDDGVAGNPVPVFAVQNANTAFMGPTTGSPATPGFRVLVLADIPDLSSVYQPRDSDLTALAALAATGFAVRTAVDTWAQRTITGTTNQVNVANGDGVSGNPTLSTPQDIHTSATPQFARLGIGVAADGTDPLAVGSGLLHVEAGGNVGIGTTAPNAKTEITGRLTLSDGGGANRYAINLESNDSGIGYASINAFDYNASAAVKLILNESGGNVGIGTSSPGEKLEVNGAIKVNNTIMIKTGTSFGDGAAANVGTLLNAPAIGDPTKWIPIDDNGTTRYIPAW